MEKPAARVTDMHACPMSEGPKPHVGGPILPPGAPTVLIGSLPAARVGDKATCVGPPDIISEGATTVVIQGMPAARMGDWTVHGGKITNGELTVLIGDSSSVGAARFGGLAGSIIGGILGGIGGAIAGFLAGGPVGAVIGAVAGAAVGAGIGYALTSQEVTTYGKSIIIEGTPEFRRETVRDLNIIASTESGQNLISSIESSGRTMRIHSDEGGGPWAWTDPPPSPGDPNPPGYLRLDGTPGTPADTEVGHDPDLDRITGHPYNTATWAQPPNMPSDDALFHEMVHADDMMHGRLDSNMGVNTGVRAGQPVPNSELRAVGLPPYQNEPYSENAYRAERRRYPSSLTNDTRGLELRDFY